VGVVFGLGRRAIRLILLVVIIVSYRYDDFSAGVPFLKVS
jgi:hypothetical protein